MELLQDVLKSWKYCVVSAFGTDFFPHYYKSLIYRWDKEKNMFSDI